MSALALLRYWPIAVVAIAIGLGWAYLAERDHRVAAEALAAERTERADSAIAAAERAETERRQADRLTVQALARTDSMRAHADSLREANAVAAHEASIRATQAGDSLAATLDSLSLVVPEPLRPLVATAERQHREERSAVTAALQAKDAEIRAADRQRDAADAAVELWRGRYESLEDAYVERGVALEAAEQALEERSAVPDGPGLRHHWVVEGLMLAGAVYAGYEAGSR